MLRTYADCSTSSTVRTETPPTRRRHLATSSKWHSAGVVSSETYERHRRRTIVSTSDHESTTLFGCSRGTAVHFASIVFSFLIRRFCRRLHARLTFSQLLFQIFLDILSFLLSLWLKFLLSSFFLFFFFIACTMYYALSYNVLIIVINIVFYEFKCFSCIKISTWYNICKKLIKHNISTNWKSIFLISFCTFYSNVFISQL